MATAAKPAVRRYSEVQPQPVEWLEKPYHPRGELVLLDGDPGVGKSTYTAMLAAQLTRGELTGSPETVIMVSLEDSPEHSIAPRLIAAEADLAMVVPFDGVPDRLGRQEPLNLSKPEHLDYLRRVIASAKPALVVIDPIMAVVGRTDIHRDNESRNVLARLSDIAREYGCEILALRHLAKGEREKALYKGLGSIAFVAQARSLLMMAPVGDGMVALAHVKANLSKLGPTRRYEIEGAEIEGLDGAKVETTRLVFAGLDSRNADDLLAPDDGSELSRAKAFLVESLQCRPVAAKDVLEMAQARGISERTLHRAKKELGVVSLQQGRQWYWQLDELEVEEEDEEGEWNARHRA